MIAAGSPSAILWAVHMPCVAVAAGCANPNSSLLSDHQDAVFVEDVIMVMVVLFAAMDKFVVLPNGSSPTPSGNRLAINGPIWETFNLSMLPTRVAFQGRQ